MTVSKALRGATDISAQTKTRIKLLAQQMGYVPDSMAQGLRSRTTKLLGLVLSTVTNPIFARTISAIEEGAHEWGYDLILAHTLEYSRTRGSLHPPPALAARGRAVYLFRFTAWRPPPRSTRSCCNAKPQPLSWATALRSARSSTTWKRDDVTGSYLMTRHLLELGHKRIAFLSGPSAAPWAQERLEGYRRALREAQIEPDDRLDFSAGTTIEEGEKAALQALNESVSMTALQAANDLVAMGAANVLLNQGVKIPEDLSLTGYGNISMSEHFRVPLTTVRQPKLRLGVAAMEIMQKLRRGERPESKRLAAEIIVRASTSAPKPETPR